MSTQSTSEAVSTVEPIGVAPMSAQEAIVTLSENPRDILVWDAAVDVLYDTVRPLCKQPDAIDREERNLWEWLMDCVYEPQETPQKVADDWDAWPKQANEEVSC